jgi:hypothetical protein
MRFFLLGCLATTLCFEVGGSLPARKTFSHLPQASQSQDISLLKPEHIAYADAMEFARFLNDRGITVESVHRSKLEGFFRAVDKAAFFRTDRGVVEVIFFPDPGGAETIQVTEQPGSGRYLYSFQGQPNPNPPGDRFDSNRPMYFLKHRNWFIVLTNEELYDELQRILMEG